MNEAALDIEAEERFEAVVRLLHLARGRERALTLDELTEKAGMSSRRVTEHLIERNLERMPWTLVSDAAGYYQPTSAEEINHYRDSLRRRAIKIFRRAKTVARKALAAGWKRDGNRFARPPMQGELFA